MIKVLAASISLVCLLSACSSHRLSQGRSFSLTKVNFSDLPGWQSEDLTQALPALQNACLKPSAEWQKFCADLPLDATDSELRTYLEKKLTPYQVSVHGKTTGKITGYYEAELTGSRTQLNGVQMPIYGAPADYQNGKKFPTRRDIEQKGKLNAPIIAWADDPVELFILHVQGSGRMMTPDGEIRLGYAGNNGRPFKGIGSILAEENLLGETGHSMPQIKEWLQDHPEEAQDLMARNPRYIFFREISGETPIGTAGVPLTPMHSVAVDTAYIPLQTPMWLSTQDPDGTPLQHLVVAQDTGNAIKGGIRADFFWGHGEEAFHKAGRMNQQGSYYLLLPD